LAAASVSSSMQMKVSYLLDILVGGPCNIDQLPVGEVGK
jgi:hypothetical protein